MTDMLDLAHTLWAEQVERRAIADRQAILTGAISVGAKDAEVPTVDQLVGEWTTWLETDTPREVDMVEWIREQIGGAV